MEYSEEYINYILNCEKIIIDPPPKNYKEESCHRKKNFSLKSSDGQLMFRAYIRCNIKFVENFSIGLDYVPKGEKGFICLLRCNGPHVEKINIPHLQVFIYILLQMRQ